MALFCFGKEKVMKAAKTIKSIYVDMDGVLAEWRKDKTIRDTYEKGYFSELRPYTNVVEAVKEIKEVYPEISVNILSAVSEDNPYAIDEKTEWIRRYLPEIDSDNVFFVNCGCRKSVVCPGMTKDDVLIDDYNGNLDDWKEHGGETIKLYNGVNSPLSASHHVVDKDMPSEAIVLSILNAIDILACESLISA